MLDRSLSATIYSRGPLADYQKSVATSGFSRPVLEGRQIGRARLDVNREQVIGESTMPSFAPRPI